MARSKKTILTILFAVCGFLVSSCYVPDDFVGDVVLEENGNFMMSYEGILTWAPFYSKIKKGEMSAEQAKDEILKIKADLERDKNFTQIKSIGDAQFAVKYQNIGRLKVPSQITFVRRDSMIMKIVTGADGITTFKGRWLTPEKVKSLTSVGLNVRGIFRLKTNAKVLDTNADKVERLTDGFHLYTWNVDNFNKPAPTLSVHLNIKK